MTGVDQKSGGVRKSRWPSWAPVPKKPTVSVDVKQYFNKYEAALVPRGFADVSAHAVSTP